MTEIDILLLFYDQMKAQSVTRNDVFLNMDEQAAAQLSAKLNTTVSIDDVHRLTDACIANEWLERTTIDPGYNFLSLSEAGLQIILSNQYPV
jgi:hypothetical protein